MAVIIALLILAYSLFYSGFSQWSTGGQGLTFFEAIGVPAGATLTAFRLGTPTNEAIKVQPETAQFMAQASSFSGQPQNPNQVANV